MRRWWIPALLLCLLLAGPASAETREGPLIVTEACGDNDFIWTLGFQDYIEICNSGSEAVSLSGYTVQINSKTGKLPAGVLQPGEYRVVSCDGKDIPRIPQKGCRIRLLRDGVCTDEVTVPAMNEQVWQREYGPVWSASPGYPNTPEGERDWYGSVPRDLIISEALSANYRGMRRKERGTDVLELQNTGSRAVHLSDYWLSDNPKRPLKYQLPDVYLEPGCFFNVFCVEEEGLTNTGFKLSSKGERISLSLGDGTVVDILNIPPLPVDTSYGRKNGQVCYFSEPTFGGVNGEGFSRIAERPVFSVPSGGYETPVSVEIQGEGPIYYTTDGSVPTRQSRQYTGPLLLKGNTTLRAVSWPRDAAASPAATAVYRFDTAEHGLPCVFITVPKDYLSNRVDGLLRNVSDKDLEVPACVTMINADGSLFFSLDCGLGIAGQTSRARPNRGWKVSFRDKYGQGRLRKKVFPDFDCESFDSLLFRLGTTGNPMHDILATAAGKDELPDVLYQHYRPVVLYIGEAYYGVFYLREHANANYIVNHLGGTEDQVDMVYRSGEIRIGTGKDWLDLMEYCRTHDLADQACCDYVTSRINVNSFIDYYIWRAYTGDTDAPNIRMVRSREGRDSRWHLLIYDMDWAFSNTRVGMDYYIGVHHDDRHYSNLVIRSLLKNKSIRQLFMERFRDAMDRVFQPDRVLGILDRMADEIRPEMPATQKKWGSAIGKWESALKQIRNRIRSDGYDRREKLIAETEKCLERRFPH